MKEAFTKLSSLHVHGFERILCALFEFNVTAVNSKQAAENTQIIKLQYGRRVF